MKRKVIQIANSTQLISLPRKWSLQFGIKKGDELEVEEKGSQIIVSTEKGVKNKNVVLDVTDMDRSSIIFYIRSAYRKGYDEIEIHYKRPMTTHLRKDERKKISSIIYEEVYHLIGVEILKQKEDMCVIKDISNSSEKDFDIILRRIFLLLIEMGNDLLEGAKTKNDELLNTIEDRHDNITKLVSYCLRLLNKKGYPDVTQTSILFYIISNLENITDILKWGGRDMTYFKPKFTNDAIKVMDGVIDLIRKYYKIYYKFDTKGASELYELRSSLLTKIKNHKLFSGKELIILNNLAHINEIIVNLTETKMCMHL